MNHQLTAVCGLVAATLGTLVATPAQAASPTQVTADWKGGASLPSDVTMWVYKPTTVATNPPILTLVHYCGGTASAVFGQAATLIKVVDQNGAIVVLPSSGRCWDVQSTKGLTRDGGGDSHAIAQMVRYAITTYSANAERVYSTGDSSGGMMTQLLLALYPDIFKAGSSFAGMPAGCRSSTETGTGYSGACAGGNVTKTAQEWGDLARKMGPANYSGHRARVQLFHGDKDGTISYKTFGEAVKEWANVLGLDPTTPTSTSTVTLGSHQATRQSWKNACGYLVLDAFTSIGGDHGPSDCLFNSNVAPFLGLDKTGAVDPEIQQCGSTGGGGSSGAGGGTGAGGATGGGGASGGRDGGPGREAGSAGAGGDGGSVGGGGSTGSTSGRGGATESGGREGTGGSGTGGSSGKGGAPGTGGTQGSGGAPGSGGVAGSGGSTAKGGSGGSGSGGTPNGSGGNPGSGGSSTGKVSSDSGCALGGAAATKDRYADAATIALGAALLALLRRRRRAGRGD